MDFALTIEDHLMTYDVYTDILETRKPRIEIVVDFAL